MQVPILVIILFEITYMMLSWSLSVQCADKYGHEHANNPLCVLFEHFEVSGQKRLSWLVYFGSVHPERERDGGMKADLVTSLQLR